MGMSRCWAQHSAMQRAAQSEAGKRRIVFTCWSS